MGAVTCSTCRFLAGADCHRYPAKARVSPEHWCGEWVSARDVEQDMDDAEMAKWAAAEQQIAAEMGARSHREPNIEPIMTPVMAAEAERAAARPPKKPGRPKKPYT